MGVCLESDICEERLLELKMLTKLPIRRADRGCMNDGSVVVWCFVCVCVCVQVCVCAGVEMRCVTMISMFVQERIYERKMFCFVVFLAKHKKRGEK